MSNGPASQLKQHLTYPQSPYQSFGINPLLSWRRVQRDLTLQSIADRLRRPLTSDVERLPTGAASRGTDDLRIGVDMRRCLRRIGAVERRPRL
jgi:hypothetical protein